MANLTLTKISEEGGLVKSIRWPDLTNELGYMVNRHDEAAKTTDKIPTIRLWDSFRASGRSWGGWGGKWPLVKFKEQATPLDITYSNAWQNLSNFVSKFWPWQIGNANSILYFCCTHFDPTTLAKQSCLMSLESDGTTGKLVLTRWSSN